MIFALCHCTVAQVGEEKSLLGSGEGGARRGVGEAGRVLATFLKCLILCLKFKDNFQSRFLVQPFWFSSKVTQIPKTEEKNQFELAGAQLEKKKWRSRTRVTTALARSVLF